MDIDEGIEFLEFKLKLLSRRRRKNILVSIGKIEDKEKLLPSIQKLAKTNTTIYSTSGTHHFLSNHSVTSLPLFKISENKSPNIQEFLSGNRFDLVINVRRSINSHEASDGNFIRSFCVEKGIPLLTDSSVIDLTIDRMLKRENKKPAAWDMKQLFLEEVHRLGGFACYHAHLDKAYLISEENLKLSMTDMQKKWELYKYLKENYTHKDLVTRMSRGLDNLIKSGVTHCRTFVDADDTVKLLPIKAALEVRERYSKRISMEIAVQPLQGVLHKESRKYFTQACELADIVGGLPSKDRPTPGKHLDFIMSLAKDLNKPIDAHTDQENNPAENESEELARYTIKHGLEGRVNAVHCISLAAKEETDRKRIISLMKDAGLSVIICPSAALSMKPLQKTAPIHNSIAPFSDLMDAKIPMYWGIDNIADLFMPIVDGDAYFEARLLMEACRYYDIHKVAAIACDRGLIIEQ